MNAELLAALQAAQMALMGYTHQNDLTRAALAQAATAIANAKNAEPFIILATREGRALLRKFDRQGTPAGMEDYSRGVCQIVCSTSEREDWEFTTDSRSPESDELNDAQFASLSGYLNDNAASEPTPRTEP